MKGVDQGGYYCTFGGSTQILLVIFLLPTIMKSMLIAHVTAQELFTKRRQFSSEGYRLRALLLMPMPRRGIALAIEYVKHIDNYALHGTVVIKS